MRAPGTRAVVAITLGVAAVAGSGVAALTSLPRDTASVTALPAPPYVAPSKSPSPTESESPTPSPTPAPATAAPTVTAPPATTAAPEPTEAPPTYRLSDVHPILGKVPPGTRQYPHAAGQTAWDVTMDGIRARVSIPAAIRAGEWTTWRVELSSAGNGCCTATLAFGDGYDAGTCDAAPSRTFRHMYNHAGRHPFAFQSGLDMCVKRLLSFTGWFDVLPGRTSAQGPAQPTVEFGSYGDRPGYENDSRYVSLYIDARDEDGFFGEFVVDFGDGKTATYSGSEIHQNECVPSLDGWPHETHAGLHYDPPEFHRYDAPGAYPLTVTVYSTGCDRTSDPQTATASFEWVVAPD